MKVPGELKIIRDPKVRAAYEGEMLRYFESRGMGVRAMLRLGMGLSKKEVLRKLGEKCEPFRE
jgi:hypothetical protein